jgi:hypothetical protein
MTIRFLLASLLLAAFPAMGQITFQASCNNPNYPSLTPTAIDSQCGADGKGETEAKQNEAKNNFCATDAQPITITQLGALQQKVQKDGTIPFGNIDTHPLSNTPGPATDRSALVALGEGNEVVLTGFVKIARQEGAESVNCSKSVPDDPAYHDIHISIVTTPGKSECSGVVVEMIPHHRPSSWTAKLVNSVAKARRPVRVTGQLMFDSSHSPCISGKSVKDDPARVSLWEVHPIYRFEICQVGNCTSESGWVPQENWKQ